MARKIKKPKPPPLSVTDGALYLLFFLLCFAWMVSSYFVYHHFQAMIAGADSGARMWNNYKTEWGWMVFPVCSAMAGAFVFAIWYPTPLFGNPKVRYGQYPYHEYAPLFSRTLPLREHQPEVFARKHRQTLIALAAFVLALLLGLPGLCPRDVLMEDGSIAHHDTLNRCTETVLPDDIRFVTFTTRHRELSRAVHTGTFMLRRTDMSSILATSSGTTLTGCGFCCSFGKTWSAGAFRFSLRQTIRTRTFPRGSCCP